MLGLDPDEKIIKLYTTPRGELRCITERTLGERTYQYKYKINPDGGRFLLIRYPVNRHN